MVPLDSQSGSHARNGEIAQHLNEYFLLTGAKLFSSFHDCEALRRYLDDDCTGLSFVFPSTYAGGTLRSA